MKKNLLLCMVVILISLPVLAGSKEWSAFALTFEDDVTVYSVTEPYVPRINRDKITFDRPNIGSMIMGGVLGNILGSLGGIYLGAGMLQDEHDMRPLVICWSAGSALGTAAGVSLAGSSENWRGNPGMAYLGGVLGIGVSWLIVSSPTFQVNAGLLSLVPLVILPPVVSAIFYRSSMRPRRLPAGNALLNISTGRLGLGVPDVRVRPIFVTGCGSKPELQFNVKVLSVEI